MRTSDGFTVEPETTQTCISGIVELMAANHLLVIQFGSMVTLLDAASCQLSEEQPALELPGV